MNPNQADQIRLLHEVAMQLKIDWIMCPSIDDKAILKAIWQNSEGVLADYLRSITVPFIGTTGETK